MHSVNTPRRRTDPSLTMKVAKTNSQDGKKVRMAPQPPPILILEAQEEAKKQDDYAKLKLRTHPDNPNSDTYELHIAYFEQGTPEKWLKFKKNYERIQAGLKLTAGPQNFLMVRTLLRGDALRIFNHAASTHDSETMTAFQDCMAAVTLHVFPRKALARQKRYLCRVARKPRDMSVRQYAARIVQLNDDLPNYPEATVNDKLDKDELVEVIEAGLPGHWNQEMLLQGFDVTAHSLMDLVEFGKRLETAETVYNTTFKNGPRSGRNDDNKTKKPASRDQRRNPNFKQKWCELHQTKSHNTTLVFISPTNQLH